MVLTILKHISQWEGLSHILWKKNNVWNHQPDIRSAQPLCTIKQDKKQDMKKAHSLWHWASPSRLHPQRTWNMLQWWSKYHYRISNIINMSKSIHYINQFDMIFGLVPINYSGWWLVYLPLWKMMEWKSVGMMTFPTEWKTYIKHNPTVPKHQPVRQHVKKYTLNGCVKSTWLSDTKS